MELKSAISSVFLHAGKHLKASHNQRRYPVPLLLTGNRLDTAEISHILNCSVSLVEVYQQIDKELDNKNA
jgi:hypothetical protein